MEEIEFSQWLFEGRPRQGKNVLPELAVQVAQKAIVKISKFLESPHQVDMKHVFKSSKHFFGYFNALETLSDIFEVKMGCEVRSYTHTLLNSPYSRKNSRFH